MKKIANSTVVFLFLAIALCQQIYADSFSATALTAWNSTSPYAREKNVFYANGNAGQCTWYAYGRVVELVEKGELDPQAQTILYNAFLNKTGRHARYWPDFIGGTWTCTTTTALPVEKRHKGLLAVWKFGDAGHVGFVEEVNADKTQYRLSDFIYVKNPDGTGKYNTRWYPFQGNDSMGKVYPCFYELPAIATTASKPNAPSNISSVTSASSITLKWKDNSSNEIGFYVYRWNGTSWAYLTGVGQNATSYTNSGLSSGTTYYYSLCAYNSAGKSCSSDYKQATGGGESWTGVDPSGAICKSDAVTVATTLNSYGKVELRWSNNCKTNWTRVTPNYASYSTYAKIRRTSDQRSYTTSGTGTRSTAMVYAPSTVACASGKISNYALNEVCR